MGKKGLYLLVFMLLMSTCYAARLHGTVYDLSLEKISGVVIELDTTPQQRVISTDGTYAFSVNTGSYRIKALQFANNLTIAEAEEEIEIVDDGDYTLDLFLYPSFEEEEALLNSTKISVEDEPDTKLLYPIIILIAVLFILIISAIVYIYLKAGKPGRGKSPEADLLADGDLQAVIQILKKEGNRATQKEIRKQLPLSEAKVSLIISELESKEIIEKIKKGRGNIIVLKKRQ